MDKNLREKIEGLLSQNMITPNLGFLCLAYLNELIEYSEHNYSNLIPCREAIAKTILKNGVDRQLLIERINRIRKDCYPTLNGSKHKGQIKSVYEMILTGTYTFVEETIPESYIKYKSEEQYRADIARTPRKVRIENEEKSLFEITDYIEANFQEIPEKQIKQEKIKALRTKEYSLELILDTIKAYTKEIKHSLWGKQEVGVFEYFLAIVKNKLPERYKYRKYIEEQEQEIWRYNAYTVYLGEVALDECVKCYCDKEQYKGKESEIRARLERGLKELEEKESYREVCKRKREEAERLLRPQPQYKPKKKELSEHMLKLYEDLW